VPDRVLDGGGGRRAPRPLDQGRWLSVSAAARALGVSASTLRLWASEGRVPHVRTAGGHRRFSPEALRQWLAEQPARRGPPRRRGMRMPASRPIAGALRARSDRVAEAVGDLVDGAAEHAYRKLSQDERREVVGQWVALVAHAFETGSLSEAVDRARTYGRAHGLAGSSPEMALGGSLALERAIARIMAESPGALEPAQLATVMWAVDRLTAAVAAAWARAIAGRGGRPAAWGA
jgi:excisionase family DNA binding protein